MGFYTGKTVWITGASAGIGEALALESARQGAKVVLSARRVEQLEQVRQRCNLTDANSMVLPLDLEDSTGFAELVKKVIDTFGRIDVLINNGGISTRAYTKDTKMDVYRKLMEINYFGTVALTREVLPYMLAQKSGYIAATSSIAGKTGTPMRSGYAAAKHALHGFFDSLRAEVWREGVHVTIICPGYIRTDISKNALNDKGEAYNKMDKNQEQGMPPEKLAVKALKAIEKEKEEVYIGGKEIMGVYLKRFLPGVLSGILKKMEVK